MMTTNTISLQDFINAQVTNRVSRKGNYEEFGSKKQLEEAEVLEPATLKMVKEIKGTFNFSLHNSKKYLIVTLYNKTEKYRFVVIDLETLAATQQPSIKIAKKFVNELLGVKEPEVVEDVNEEEPKVEGAEQPADSKKPKSTKRNKEAK